MTRAKLDFVSNSSFTSSQKAELLKVDNEDLSFTLTYWELCSAGSTSREILVYSKAHHDFTYPDVKNPSNFFSVVFEVSFTF